MRSCTRCVPAPGRLTRSSLDDPAADMSIWLAASIALSCGLAACALACLRSRPPAGLAALNVAGVTATMLLVTLTEAFKRQPLIDLPLVLAPSAVAGGLAFVRFLERRR